MVHLVPQNNSDFFSVNNEKVDLNYMLFSLDECGPFRMIYMTWKVHIHIWGAFKKPQSVISCKACSGKLEIYSHLIAIYRPDTM